MKVDFEEQILLKSDETDTLITKIEWYLPTSDRSYRFLVYNAHIKLGVVYYYLMVYNYLYHSHMRSYPLSRYMYHYYIY